MPGSCALVRGSWWQLSGNCLQGRWQARGVTLAATDWILSLVTRAESCDPHGCHPCCVTADYNITSVPESAAQALPVVPIPPPSPGNDASTQFSVPGLPSGARYTLTVWAVSQGKATIVQALQIATSYPSSESSSYPSRLDSPPPPILLQSHV